MPKLTHVSKDVIRFAVNWTSKGMGTICGCTPMEMEVVHTNEAYVFRDLMPFSNLFVKFVYEKRLIET